MKIKKIFLIFILIFVFTPFKIFADDESIEDNLQANNVIESLDVSSTDISKTPDINARHAIVLDRNSKLMIYGKKENEICKMASTTKIMTAIIVLENSKLDDLVTVSAKSASTGGSRLGLSKNDEITVENLLYGLMMKSGNDAAVALAEHVAGNTQNFALMMNNKAQELNLSSTNYVTPHGLDNDNHYTTAFDLAKLTNYALQNEQFSKIVRTQTYTIMINGYPKTISNTNELLGNFEGIYGVKTGFTNGANRCLVTSCKRGDLDVICVVLGCDTKKDRTRDSIKLLNYVFNNYCIVDIQDLSTKKFKEWKIKHQNSFIINKGYSQFIDTDLDINSLPFAKIAVKNSDIQKISIKIDYNPFLVAPILKNSRIGNLALNIDGTQYFSIKIFSNSDIRRKNIFEYIMYIFKNYSLFFNSLK